MALKIALLLASLSSTLAADSASFKLTTKRVADIPARFVSFSIEVGSAPEVFLVGGLGGAPRASLARLVNALREAAGDERGPMVRVGGNSADESAYVPTGDLPNGTTYRISDADLEAYAAVVPMWNGSLVIDITLRYPGSPGADLDVAHLKAVGDKVGWDLVEGVEVGNEVDLFFENGIRDSSYVYRDYRPEYALVSKAIAPVVAPAGRPMVQGATWCSTHWSVANFTSYINEFASDFASLSLHRYAASVCHNDKATIPELMADKAAALLAQDLAPWTAPAIAKGIPIFIGEGNSVSCGGASGVSDVWASALWAIDVLFSVATVGIQRWSFHGMPKGAYSSIDFPSGSSDVAQVRPIFYGLWAFATAAGHGSTIREVQVAHSTNGFIKCWSVTDASGAARVVVLHKDPAATQSASVTITPASALSGAATLVRGLPGKNGIASAWDDSISFGGLTFSTTTDGTPAGTPTSEPVAASGGAYTFALPAASFAILTLPTA